MNLRLPDTTASIGLGLLGLLLAEMRLPLSPTAWVAGLSCVAGIHIVLTVALRRSGTARLTPADRVTLLRALLGAIVTALTIQAATSDGGSPALLITLTTLAGIALALDAVDGHVARRLDCVTELGARFDMEVDAWLILVLSVHVAQSTGWWWVLAIGLARYTLLTARLCLPWLRRGKAPPRYWNKVVAAIQGIVLVTASARVLPDNVMQAILIVAAALLAESFATEVAWYWRHRRYQRPRRTIPTGNHRAKTGIALSVLSALLIWIALLLPQSLASMTPLSFLRLPLAWLVLAALALILPHGLRRTIGLFAGFLIALWLLLHLLDIGFHLAFDRPFDVLSDVFYFRSAFGLLGDSIGHVAAAATVIGGGLLVIVLIVITMLATTRFMRAASLLPVGAAGRLVTGLITLWLVAAVLGIHVPSGPALAANAPARVWHRLASVHDEAADHRAFVASIGHDPMTAIPSGQLFSALHGKDVLLIFVESFGRIGIEGSTFAPGIRQVLRDGTKELEAGGYNIRSAFLTSPTFGGLSWLAHSTLESGLWINSQRRYDQLLTTGRMTLASAFKRAGWRTVADVPADTRPWPQGLAFYGFEKLYNAHNVGYRGPRFSYAMMPDQFTLYRFQQNELAGKNRKPVFAEIDLVSSHDPWTPLPHMVPWSKLGDGSIFDPMPAQGLTPEDAFKDKGTVRRLYGQSIQYSMQSLIEFLTHWPDPNRLVIMLGDHQPWKIVSGSHPGHDVPIMIVAGANISLAGIAGWHWDTGLLPSHDAPTWRMDRFRNRFIQAFTTTTDKTAVPAN